MMHWKVACLSRSARNCEDHWSRLLYITPMGGITQPGRLMALQTQAGTPVEGVQYSSIFKSCVKMLKKDRAEGLMVGLAEFQLLMEED